MWPPAAAASIEGQSPGKPFSGRARKEEETEMEKNTEKKRERKKIGDALMKVALGCRVEEVTEEYAMADGELRLTKRRERRGGRLRLPYGRGAGGGAQAAFGAAAGGGRRRGKAGWAGRGQKARAAGGETAGCKKRKDIKI